MTGAVVPCTSPVNKHDGSPRHPFFACGIVCPLDRLAVLSAMHHFSVPLLAYNFHCIIHFDVFYGGAIVTTPIRMLLRWVFRMVSFQG